EIVVRNAVAVGVPFFLQVGNAVAVGVQETAPLRGIPQRALEERTGGSAAGRERSLGREAELRAALRGRRRAAALPGQDLARRVEEVVDRIALAGVAIPHLEIRAVGRRAGNHVADVLLDAAGGVL